MAVHHVTKHFLMIVTLLASLPGLCSAYDRPMYRRGDSYGYSRSTYGSGQYGYGGYGGYGSGYGSYGSDYRHRRPDSSSESSDCVSAEPAKQRYHYYPSSGKAATCGAVDSQGNRTQALEERVLGFGGAENAAIGALSARVDSLRGDVNNLLGVGKQPLLLSITHTVLGSRLLCQVHTVIEVAEICRLFGIARVPDPFFFHLSCTDPRAVAVGLRCQTTSWVLRQNCLYPNTGSINTCLVPSPPGFVCNNILLISCTGFRAGMFALPQSERLTVQEIHVNVTLEDTP